MVRITRRSAFIGTGLAAGGLGVAAWLNRRAPTRFVVGEPGFELDPNWPSAATQAQIEYPTGVDVDADGNVLVLHRAGRAWTASFPQETITADTVLTINAATGEVVRSWGANAFIMPHGLSVSPDGTVWITDVGTDLIHIYAPDGTLIRSFGNGSDPDWAERRMGRPTDTAFHDGFAYISDGYVNARVVKLSLEGAFISEWGMPGRGPGQFRLPHSITAGPDGRLFVCDRTNARLQIFDLNGEVLDIWNSSRVGRPYAVDVRPDGRVLVLDSGDQPDATRAILIELSSEGVVQSVTPTNLVAGHVPLGHDIACDREAAVYVADVWGAGILKFSKAGSV